MTSNKSGAWSKTNSQKTLQELRKNYPRYTDNELYAIWCRDHGLLPLDANEKLDLDLWRIHAGQDGQHVVDGGFRISRAIYGRALKSKAGTGKPKQAPRGSKKEAPVGRNSGFLSENGELSPRALEIARTYDRANALMSEALNKRAAALELVSKLKGMDRCVLIDLASRGSEVRDLLVQGGALEPAEVAVEAGA
ncbi:MAG TPA: hypothetical protein VGC54_02585 [Planctomycetota bacterium]